MTESNGSVTPRVDGGRLHDGKFAKGNDFGRGNPHLKRIHALRTKLLDVVDDEAMERVGRKLVELAEAGEMEAIRTLLGYTIGRPPQAVELSGTDGEPLGMDLGRLQVALLGALADHPEARSRVARALMDLGNEHERAAIGRDPA